MIGLLLDAGLPQVRCSLGRSTLAPMRALMRSLWGRAALCQGAPGNRREPVTRAHRRGRKSVTEGQLWQRDPNDSMARFFPDSLADATTDQQQPGLAQSLDELPPRVTHVDHRSAGALIDMGCDGSPAEIGAL